MEWSIPPHRMRSRATSLHCKVTHITAARDAEPERVDDDLSGAQVPALNVEPPILTPLGFHPSGVMIDNARRPRHPVHHPQTSRGQTSYKDQWHRFRNAGQMFAPPGAANDRAFVFSSDAAISDLPSPCLRLLGLLLDAVVALFARHDEPFNAGLEILPLLADLVGLL